MDPKKLGDSMSAKTTTNAGESEESEPPKTDTEGKKNHVRYFVWFVKLLVFLLVLATLIASKVSITTMIGHLHSMTPFGSYLATNTTDDREYQNEKTAIRLYWQLLIILAVPNLITWVRSLFNGIVGKSSTQPRPENTAIIAGVVVATVEAISETALLFCGWILPPPEISIFLMNGMCLVPGFIQLSKYGSSACTKASSNEGKHDSSTKASNIEGKHEPSIRPCCYSWCSKHSKILNAISQVVGLLFQIVGIVLVCVFVGLGAVETAPVMTWIVMVGIASLSLLLSTTWIGAVHTKKLLFRPNLNSISSKYRAYAKKNGYDITARWKASFIAATVRLLLYPFTSYVIFRYTYRFKTEQNYIAIDPWCLENDISIGQTLTQWKNQEMVVFLIHIMCSFLAYSLSWLACYTTLHKSGLALPVLLATPASLAVYLLMTYLEANVGFKMDKIIDFPVFNTSAYLWLILAIFFAGLLWIGQCMINVYRLWTNENNILASDKEMFVRPYYSSILLEQYLILNRNDCNQQTKNKKLNDSTVFICSTMFRENATEMNQMLSSLKRVAKFYKSARNETCTSDKTNFKKAKFESHIFFDGGSNNGKILQFGIQLVNLIPDALGVALEQVKSIKTPYGCRFEWSIEADENENGSDIVGTGMPFVVHFKDNNKVKNKKRWSQVMYMNYVINHRATEENLDLSNTFILTTDADIEFKAKSAYVLLDMLARDPHVGAVSSRTRPKGSGLLYWYQVFDYAVGHWLQKPAEHILGCVLCCPGCFSIFRCSALKDCLEKYSGEVNSALDFLTKDMGEDRWLCTLLVEKGWRLEYCAISKNKTFCPVEFDEFFKQRRRWIPSTVANLWLLVSSAKNITQSNKTINYLFIIYQSFIILSTVLAPATVILIISACLQQIHDINQIALISSLLAISVLYGLACIFTNQRTQLDLAKMLTLFFAILMVAVVVGLIRGVVDDIRILFINQTMDTADFRLPVDVSTLYSGFFALVFPITAVLHYRECMCLIQSIWYLLGLPGGYLVLLIYSAANLNSRSWGTREAKRDNDNEIVVQYKKLKKRLLSCVCCWKDAQRRQSAIRTEDKSVGTEMDSITESTDDYSIEHSADEQVDDGSWLSKWLSENKCSHFHDNFVKEGYDNECFVSGITREDLENIGVEPIGLVRRLEMSAKNCYGAPIRSKIPNSIKQWLEDLKMPEDYCSKFEDAGYSKPEDVEHLKEITDKELEKYIGVKKIGHRKRLMKAIKMLRKLSKEEEKMQATEAVINKKLPKKMDEFKDDDPECIFWNELIKDKLCPVPVNLCLTDINELERKLKGLRYSALIGIFLINLIWIVLFLTLTFEELVLLNINPRVLIIVFLAIYGVILLIQFVTMIIHRFVTLAHYIYVARLNCFDEEEPSSDESADNKPVHAVPSDLQELKPALSDKSDAKEPAVSTSGQQELVPNDRSAALDEEQEEFPSEEQKLL